MRSTLVFLTLCIISISISAQDLRLDWAKAIGPSGFKWSRALYTDTSGNVYNFGEFSGTVDFDPSEKVHNLKSKGGDDIFILKLDNQGNFLWARSIGGFGTERAISITVDASENVYMTGTFKYTVDFDPGATSFKLTSVGTSDIFILKLSERGDFKWAKSNSGEANNQFQQGQGFHITIDAVGDLCLVGHFSGTVDFDPGPSTRYLTAKKGSGFIQKLDISGNLLSIRTVGTSVYHITFDASNNSYINGAFFDTADLDPGPAIVNQISSGGMDAYILKMNDKGKVVWSRSMGGINNEIIGDIVLDELGNLFFLGSYKGRVDFDLGPDTFYLPNTKVNCSFLEKMDTMGNFIWAKKYDGVSSANLVIHQNNLFVGGIHYPFSDLDLGPDTFYFGFTGDPQNIFVQKLNDDGELIWVYSIGGPRYEMFADMNLGQSGDVYLTGNFQDTADFDPSEKVYHLSAQVGSNDIFLAKFNTTSLGHSETLNKNLSMIYPNPTKGLINIDLRGQKRALVRVFDINGRTVHKEQRDPGIWQLNLKDHKGFYLLEIKTNDITEFHKLVVE